MFDIGSLETITEEETSKECSPLFGSPTPHRAVSEPPNGDATANKLTDSEELQRLLKQITDTIHQTENIKRETHNSSSQQQQQQHAVSSPKVTIALLLTTPLLLAMPSFLFAVSYTTVY